MYINIEILLLERIRAKLSSTSIVKWKNDRLLREHDKAFKFESHYIITLYNVFNINNYL